MKFVDVTNDIAFRKIFGNENKTQILISFLNAILKFEGKEKIESLTFVSPFQLPRIAGEKASIIDVRAIDFRGNQFIIEMQMAEADGFDKRVQYYTCRDYSMQINRGENYTKLRPTFFIGILDFNYFQGEDYLSNHLILDEKTKEHKLKDIKFTFIELPKFKVQLEELKTLVEKWIFFIKNAENLDFIPENTDDQGLIEAYRDADKHSWTKEELISYDNAFIAIQDRIGQLNLAMRRANKQGLEQGIELGIKGLLLQNILSHEQIAQAFNVDIAIVKAIAAKL